MQMTETEKKLAEISFDLPSEEEQKECRDKINEVATCLKKMISDWKENAKRVQEFIRRSNRISKLFEEIYDNSKKIIEESNEQKKFLENPGDLVSLSEIERQKGLYFEGDEALFSPIRSNIENLPLIQTMFAIDEQKFLHPFNSVISELQSMLDVFTIQSSIDSILNELPKTEKMRRKPLFRELKRKYQQLIDSSGIISFNNAGAGGVSERELTMNFIMGLVEEAKEHIKALKKVV